jgi:amylosucrase
VRLAEHALSRRRPAPSPTAWVSYLRCHDDIGWAVPDEDAAAVSLGGFAHRRFLNDFYAGQFPGSFARGALFQQNPVTGDARISGSAASLCGIGSALASGDPGELAVALRRLESMYAVVFSFGGIPLIYMGDELALRNDPGWRDDPAQADDNRWMHRPRMDWAVAARRHDLGSLEGQVFAAIAGLAAARRDLLALRSGGTTEILPVESPAVLAYRRVHPRSAPFLSVTNFSDYPQSIDGGVIGRAGLHRPQQVRATITDPVQRGGRVELPPWGFGWLSGGS